VSSNGTFPLPDGINVKFRPEVITLPQIYQYNLTAQYQLTNKIAVQGGYVGNVDRHAFWSTSNNSLDLNEPVFVPGVSNTNLNRPYFAKYGWTQGLSYFCDCDNAHYNSFQGQARINAWAGWTLQASYTYQRSVADGNGPYDGNYYIVYGPRSAGAGYSSFLPRQQWTFANVYDIPFGKGRKWGSNMNRIADAALGGWELSGITTYYSGFPFSPTLENYGAQGGQPNAGPSNRPDLGSGDPYGGAQGNRNQWFVGCPNLDCSASASPYAIPAANTFGNYPIGVLFGPHFIQQDLSIFKSFKFTERWSFTLRTDARNVFNHTNLGGPNSDVQSPNAGQITGIAAGGYMRQLQFSGTIRF
jgi:hypothetical protein